MAEPKTRPTDVPPMTFIGSIEDATRREDSVWLVEMMSRVTGEEPIMWGTSIVGFGTYRYAGSDGKEMTWPMAGFSPRKQNMTVYLMPGFQQRARELAELGPHSTGVSCLYMKRLEDVDREVLTSLVRESVDEMHTRTRGGTEVLRSSSNYANSDLKMRRDAAKKTTAKKKKTSAKKASAKKALAKKALAKKAPAKKAPAKKAPAKKAPAKKKSAKKKSAKERGVR